MPCRVPFVRFSVAGALMVFVVAGCGNASHSSTVAGQFPVVVAHPKVQTSGLSNARVRGLQADDAVLLLPSQVAFLTSGGISCVWLPKRLTVLGNVTDCGSGAVPFPIAVTIPPIVNFCEPVTLRLAHKVRVGGRTNQWSQTAVAPAHLGCKTGHLPG